MHRVWAPIFLEVSCLKWSDLSSTIQWEPNKITVEEAFCSRLKRKVSREERFTIVKNFPITKHVEISSPLFCSIEIKLRRSEIKSHRYGANNPICPSQRSFRGKFHSSTNKHGKVFSPTGVAALLGEGINHQLLETALPNMVDTIAKFVSMVKTLPKNF